MENKEVVLSVKDLAVSFKTDRGIVHAVRGVSFDLYKGETLCIVGESGSGKSVTNKAIMGISAANAIIENGSIMYKGEDLIRVSEEEFHRIRGHEIGMIFQDPLSALNPVMRIGKQITEAMLINKNILKRYYQNLIIKELTALRNVEANANFEISEAENEIAQNNETIKKLDAIIKKHNSLSSKSEKNEKDVKKLENVSEEFNKTQEDFTNYINMVNTSLTSKIEKCNDVIASSDKKVAEATTNLKKEIRLNRKKRYEKLLEFYKNIEGKYSADFSKYKETLQTRNSDLKALIKITKANLKFSLPALKKDFALRKKEAKKETKLHKEELANIHKANLSKLNEDLDKKTRKIEEFIGNLSENDRENVFRVLKENEKKTKIKKKLEGKNRDINISKLSKDNSLDLEKIPFDELAKLYEEVDKIKKDISLENENYIKQTKITRAEAKKEALKVMKEVGIPLPERRFRQYPFEFSGGMRQRIVIAIALTANPDILICDEPTTALDVTIQAQILELINKLKKERNLSCIFITHDLGVVANMADRVAVMYAGKIVEYGTAREVFFDPKHPYTWALLSSIPDVDSKEKLEAIPGTPPDMLFPPKGDAFALRSKYAMAVDFKYEPPFFKVTDTHYAATWLLYPDAAKVEMPQIVKTRIANSLKAERERIEKAKLEEVKEDVVQ